MTFIKSRTKNSVFFLKENNLLYDLKENNCDVIDPYTFYFNEKLLFIGTIKYYIEIMCENSSNDIIFLSNENIYVLSKNEIKHSVWKLEFTNNVDYLYKMKLNSQKIIPNENGFIIRLAHFSIILDFEDPFKIIMKTDEIIDFKKVGEFYFLFFYKKEQLYVNVIHTEDYEILIDEYWFFNDKIILRYQNNYYLNLNILDAKFIVIYPKDLIKKYIGEKFYCFSYIHNFKNFLFPTVYPLNQSCKLYSTSNFIYYSSVTKLSIFVANRSKLHGYENTPLKIMMLDNNVLECHHNLSISEVSAINAYSQTNDTIIKIGTSINSIIHDEKHIYIYSKNWIYTIEFNGLNITIYSILI